MTARPPRTLCIDVGGTAIKASLLSETGSMLSGEPSRVLTPRPATVAAMLDALERTVLAEPRADRVAIGFPGVVIDGVAHSAPNLDGPWVEVPLCAVLAERLAARGRSMPLRAVNDADLAGLGAAEGAGMEMLLTLGTGMGSAVLMDGTLVPNLELGHHPWREGKCYEELLGDAELSRVGKSRWRERVMAAVAQMRPVWNFRRLYVGGGNARLLEQTDMPPDVELVDNSVALRGGVKLWRYSR